MIEFSGLDAWMIILEFTCIGMVFGLYFGIRSNNYNWFLVCRCNGGCIQMTPITLDELKELGWTPTHHSFSNMPILRRSSERLIYDPEHKVIFLYYNHADTALRHDTTHYKEVTRR